MRQIHSALASHGRYSISAVHCLCNELNGLLSKAGGEYKQLASGLAAFIDGRCEGKCAVQALGAHIEVDIHQIFEILQLCVGEWARHADTSVTDDNIHGPVARQHLVCQALHTELVGDIGGDGQGGTLAASQPGTVFCCIHALGLVASSDDNIEPEIIRQ